MSGLQTHLPIGAVAVLTSSAGSVRSRNHRAPPSARPGHSATHMRRMAHTLVTNTGSCVREQHMVNIATLSSAANVMRASLMLQQHSSKYVLF